MENGLSDHGERVAAVRDSVSFYRSETGALRYRLDGEVFKDLGSMLMSDIQNFGPGCLEYLGTLEDVRAGRLEPEEIEGNAYQLVVTRAGVRVQNMYIDSGGDYTHDEVHAVLIRYWKWLVPDEAKREQQIEAWEREFGRVHPCREHLA